MERHLAWCADLLAPCVADRELHRLRRTCRLLRDDASIRDALPHLEADAASLRGGAALIRVRFVARGRRVDVRRYWPHGITLGACDQRGRSIVGREPHRFYMCVSDAERVVWVDPSVVSFRIFPRDWTHGALSRTSPFAVSLDPPSSRGSVL